jgi:hypothetical protein
MTERADMVISRIQLCRLNEYLVLHVSVGGDHRARLVPVDRLGRGKVKFLVSHMISSPPTPDSDVIETNVCRNFRGVSRPSMPDRTTLAARLSRASEAQSSTALATG